MLEQINNLLNEAYYKAKNPFVISGLVTIAIIFHIANLNAATMLNLAIAFSAFSTDN